MNQLADFLPVFVLLPLLGFVVSLLIPERNEGLLSTLAFSLMGLQAILVIIFTALWVYQFPTTVLNAKELVVYKSNSYEFYIDFCYDHISAVFLFMGSILSFLVTLYSRYYLHREDGYKRFFNTILFFYLGYNLTIISGNFETLFIGWEILGISSFLLIAFYRERYLPVKNALKVFSIYRMGDVGILLAMWMSHHLWHSNIAFIKLSNYELVHEHLQQHTSTGLFISLMILIAAAAKSAQLPFSSWLPRAMEGPTPSSAIFYGSLSVHIGVFLLLRTYPFWEHQMIARVAIGLVGLTTALVTTGIARVQSSIKSQIAYGSAAQIGIIFIEVALGWHYLALIHFMGNAFLRTYQLLVSPSVVTYLIREQFYDHQGGNRSVEDSYPRKWEYALYLLSIKEWNLDTILYRYFWNPIKRLARPWDALRLPHIIGLFVGVYGLGWAFLYADYLPTGGIRPYLPFVFAALGLGMSLKAFAERKSVRTPWVLIIMNHFWMALAISYNENITFSELAFYLSGVVVFGTIGLLALSRIKSLEKDVSMERFLGHSYEHPKIAILFLICSLGLSGFPISPTFIGEDLLFSHIHENQLLLAALTAMSFIIDGLAIIRIYARVFMGPHVKTYHEVANRAS